MILRPPVQGPVAFAADMLRRQRRVLWLGLLLGMAGAVVWNKSQPDIYQSRAVLRVPVELYEEEQRHFQLMRQIEVWDAERAGKPPPPQAY